MSMLILGGGFENTKLFMKNLSDEHRFSPFFLITHSPWFISFWQNLHSMSPYEKVRCTPKISQHRKKSFSFLNIFNMECDD